MIDLDGGQVVVPAPRVLHTFLPLDSLASQIVDSVDVDIFIILPPDGVQGLLEVRPGQFVLPGEEPGLLQAD